MVSPPNNENRNSYGNLAERHHRRGAGSSVKAPPTPQNSAGRRRGLPENNLSEFEEQDYQARYEKQLHERREQRANERRASRKREILSGRIEKRSRKKPPSEATWRGIKITLIVLVASISLVIGIIAYDKLTGSQLFVLKEVELQGTTRVSREELLQLLAPYKSRSLWQLDLVAIRSLVEKNPWVMEAEVSRVLPDSLRVTIHEREPVAPWRMPSNTVVWVDREGRNLGELDFNQTNQVPPILSGLEEGDGNEVKAANRRRMEIYQRLLTEVDQINTKFSGEIDEVNLQDGQAVKVHLTKHNVSVLLGANDFGTRLEKALRLLEKIEQKEISSIGFLNKSDAERLVQGERIVYLNVMHPERVVVGFK